jgi:aminomethyltransferase
LKCLDKGGDFLDKKTPLYDCHIAHKGKIVPFAGYLLPVQYESGVIKEHMSVRTNAGLFDVSHMGEVVFAGKDALANINMLFTNDFTSMTDGQVRYSPMCNENGGIVDDLIVYRLNAEKYMAVINACNRQKDVEWIKERLFGEIIFEDISDSMAQIALQGPKSSEILAKITDDKYIPKKYYTFIDDCYVKDVKCLISRTGYTGEHGYEFYCAPEDAAKLWGILMEAGKDEGLMPCGLGARDTLRLEAGMPLYGHEMTDDISPLETGLDIFVKMEKPDFIGKDGIIKRGAPKRRRIGLKITGRGIVRENSALYDGDNIVGETTSGTHCPYLNSAYAMALVNIACSHPGAVLEADVRQRRISAEVVPLPFYKKK